MCTSPLRSAFPYQVNDASGRYVVCVFEPKFRERPWRRNKKNDQILSHPAAFSFTAIAVRFLGTSRRFPWPFRTSRIDHKWSTFRLSRARRSPNFVIERTNEKPGDIHSLPCAALWMLKKMLETAHAPSLSRSNATKPLVSCAQWPLPCPAS